MDPAEEQAPGRHRQATGDRPGAPELGRLPLSLDLALDGRPEELEQLRHQDHRRRPMVADRLEDDPWVAGPDVHDVGTEVEDQVEPDRLLEQVGERQHGGDAVVHVRDQLVEPVDAGQRVLVRQHHALRRARRARGEDEQVGVARLRARPRLQRRLPVRRERGIGLRAQLVERDGRHRLQVRPRGVRGVASGTDRELHRPRTFRDPGDGGGSHSQVERHEDQTRPHRPEVGGGKLGAGCRPCQQPVARSQPAGAEPPRGQPAPTVELAVAPRLRLTVIAAQRERGPLAVASRRSVEEVDEGPADLRHRPIVEDRHPLRNGVPVSVGEFATPPLPGYTPAGPEAAFARAHEHVRADTRPAASRARRPLGGGGDPGIGRDPRW